MDRPSKPINNRSSISGPDLAEVKCKRCNVCWALYPITHFSLAKWRGDGYRGDCNECRNIERQLDWTKKYGRKRPYEAPAIERNVSRHNAQILNQALSHMKMELRGFDCQTKMDYKIFVGPSERSGLKAFTLFTRNGMLFREYAYSGDPDPKPAIMVLLRTFNIRLELSDEDVIASKTMIYYL